MSLNALREEVLEANLELVRRGLVLYTFGNASGVDHSQGLVAIKPSGVPYERMQPGDIVIVDLEGRVREGTLRPSSDLATHLILYRAFPEIGGVVHTHSRNATVWAQAGQEIPCFGTTHADYFHGAIPVTEHLAPAEIEGEYEANIGHAILRRLNGINPMHMPAVLVAGHAPFTWGESAAEAAYHAVVLEEVALTALQTLAVNPQSQPISRHLLDKHFFRKHGRNSYYGQAKT
ncbi:MAG TPA: L-ribulose-5-phosphate 4-epimerase AraD [Bryobacteraceae bacterium]|nr:L-ribulose-5-phosphate 4-epimerase AraD [Bryobacteraceae bacterium]